MNAKRTPSGDTCKADRRDASCPVIPPEVIAHRSHGIGGHDPTDQMAGTAIGRMLLIGIIARHHHDAGMRLAGVWQRWACIIAGKARFPTDRRSQSGGDGPSPEECERIKERMMDARQCVFTVPYGALAWSMIESIVMDDVIPPRFDPASPLRQDWPIGRAALVAGFDALASFFGISEEHS